MPCNCKKPIKQEPIVPEGITPIKVQAVIDKPKYTILDVIRMKDYLSATNKQDTEKQFIVEILQDNFGDLIPDYCDQICLKHISSRIELMEKTLTIYEQSKTK